MGISRGMQWSIRSARRSDWPDVSSISAEVSREGVIGDYINDIGEKYMDLGNVYVAETDHIIGFQHIQDVPDGSIYLSGLRILKEYRRRGIAGGMIETVNREWAERGKKYARALVEVDNAPSLALMSELGFRRVADLNLYHGTVDLSNAVRVDQWPDAYIDLGHVPSRAYPGVGAALFRQGGCLVARSDPGKWDGMPSFSILEHEECRFMEGDSFITSRSPIPEGMLAGLKPINRFERACIMELDLRA